MSTNIAVFRFLDLPAELRNRVYEFVVEDEGTTWLIDLFAVKACVPSAAVTQVSRQVRHESKDLYREATSAFWANLKISITIQSMTGKQQLEKTRQESIKLSKLPHVFVRSLKMFGPIDAVDPARGGQTSIEWRRGEGLVVQAERRWVRDVVSGV